MHVESAKKIRYAYPFTANSRGAKRVLGIDVNKVISSCVSLRSLFLLLI